MRLSSFKIRVIIMNLAFLMVFLGMRVAQRQGEAQCTPYVPVLCNWAGPLSFNGYLESKDYLLICGGGVLTGMQCTNCP